MKKIDKEYLLHAAINYDIGRLEDLWWVLKAFQFSADREEEKSKDAKDRQFKQVAKAAKLMGDEIFNLISSLQCEEEVEGVDKFYEPTVSHDVGPRIRGLIDERMHLLAERIKYIK